MRPLRLTFVAITVVVLLAQPAGAGTYINTVEDTGTISGNGHRARITIVLQCDEGERALFGGTVTQDETVGTGRSAMRCSGDVQRLPVPISAARGHAFDAGTATVDAWVELRHGQHTHARHGWTEQVTLT